MQKQANPRHPTPDTRHAPPRHATPATRHPTPATRHALLLPLLAAGLLAGTARAATVTWNGSASVAWENTNNWTWTTGGPGYPGSGDDVVIDGAGSFRPTLDLNAVAGSPYTINSLSVSATTAETLTFKNCPVATTRLRVDGNVIIGSKGTLTHSAETAIGSGASAEAEKQGLYLDVGGDMSIAKVGSDVGQIYVTGLGYQGSGNSGAGKGPGAGTADAAPAAGHGGEATSGQPANYLTYGSVTNPVRSGSGSAWGPSHGGGTVKLVIGGQLTLSGSILADGVTEGWRAGSGGSINIVAATFDATSAGTVSANGASPGSYAGAGGGRVAMVLTNAATTAFNNLTIRAYGGTTTGTKGGAGTICLKGTDYPKGRLIVDNNNQTTVYTTLVKNQTILLDRIEAKNYGLPAFGSGCTLDLTQGCALSNDASSRFIVDSAGNPTIQWPASYTIGGVGTNCTVSWKGTSEYTINCANLTVATNGVLRHEAVTSTGSNAEDHMLKAKIQGNLTIDAGGKIYVSQCGYDTVQGPCPGNNGGYAASHGGQGGGSTAEPYGSVTDPTRSGSGGFTARGGGATKLTVTGDLTLNGSISADAGGPTWCGAAGGSVNITAGTLTMSGSATISANGGGGGQHGGGGGRVAIVLTNAADSAFAGKTITAYGAEKGGGEAGAAGTVYLKGNTTTYGNLIVDNNPVTSATARRTRINANTGDITVNNVTLRNQGRLGYNATSRKVAVYGSWSNGVANADSAAATVTLAGGAPATVWGDNNWFSLSITNAGKTTSFQAAKTQTISGSGSLTLSGAAGNMLVLNSTSSGNRWNLKATAGCTRNVSYVNVTDSDASSGDPISAPNSVGPLQNNINWFFAPAVITWTGAGGAGGIWNKTNSWDLNRLPLEWDDVVIPGASPTPYLDVARSIGSLTMASGSSLSLSNKNLTISGNLTVTGTVVAAGSEVLAVGSNLTFAAGGAFAPAQSTLRLAGTGPQSLTLGGRTFYGLNIANTNAITFTDTFSTRDLTFTNTGFNVSFQDNFTATNVNGAVSGASALTFGSGKTYTIDTLALVGAAANKMTLTSSGTWALHVTGFGGVGNVAVHGSDASSYATIYAANSDNNGGNVNWDFGGGVSNKVWVGTTTPWTDGNNWSPSGEPGSTNVVLILGAGTAQPTVTFGGTKTINALAVVGASTLTFDSGDVSTKKLRVNGDAFIGPNATLTHTPETDIAGPPWDDYQRLFLDVGGNLTIDGKIDVSICGYKGTDNNNSGYGPGRSQGDGQSASHGGENGGTSTYATYDSVTDPVTSGSGTGYANRGGGVAKLTVAGALNLKGWILADSQAGGWMNGSGGSINITAGMLTGNGIVSANGGSSPNNTGGGGGRVAMVLTAAADSAFSALSVIRAYGGPGVAADYRSGASGTVYLKGTNSTYGNLIVDNNSVATTKRTPINANTGDITVNDVTLRNQGRLSYDGTGRKVTAYGSWSNGVSGAADSALATVTLAGGSPATVWGANNWYSLTITNERKVVSFQAGTTQTLNLSGTVTFDNFVTLKSTTDGSWWYLTKGSTGPTQNVGKVYTRDSNASNGWTFVALGGSDLGNSRNWRFPPQGTMIMMR